MTFFARPNLSDEQFKQQTDSTLTLSGQTQIVATSGLTLRDGCAGTTFPNVIITADAACEHVGDVLTYDGAGKIKLMPSAGGGGDPTYNPPYLSPASVSLCGINAGFVLTGKTLSCIIQTLLVPTLNPVIVPPSSTFNITPSTSSYEVGCQVTITGNATFSRGSISPQYCGTSPFRSGLPVSYLYTYYSVALPPVPSLGSCSNSCVAPLHTIVAGANNILAGWVSYASGTTAALDSSGGVFAAALPAGTTAPPVQKIICGIYPYFFGKIPSGGAPAGSNRPTPTTVCSCMVASDISRVGVSPFDSNGTISINFNSTPDDYIWFATPFASACKTKWVDTVVTVNNGNIGGAVSAGGNLFPDPDTVTPITTVCWAGQTYRVYISNYQTCTTNCIDLKNS